jgi:L-asparaginase
MLAFLDMSVEKREQSLPPLTLLEGPPYPLPETTWLSRQARVPEEPPAPSKEQKSTSSSKNFPNPIPLMLEKSNLGSYTPTLILHGGSGAISRSNLPPALYEQYRSSLLKYLESTHAKLESGSSALDAACHAVSLMEDDPLFNCGRGSVFTEKGTIEMEASVMVSSVRPGNDEQCMFSMAGGPSIPVKRGASVSLIKGTRHPILLAREVLLAGGNGLGGVGTMHCQLSGEDVEEWGWKEKGLERKGAEWFWTRRRWREHLRDLEKQRSNERGIRPESRPWDLDNVCDEKRTAQRLYPYLHSETYDDADDVDSLDFDSPSQGTVGAVCMDSWGNLAVATSTGGLTNKKAGRIGDTPTIGSGFWAESWNEMEHIGRSPDINAPLYRKRLTLRERLSRVVDTGFGDILRNCMSTLSDQDPEFQETSPHSRSKMEQLRLIEKDQPMPLPRMVLSHPTGHLQHDGFPPPPRRRAVAMSGTGNGDSFLRTSAVRTTAAMCRFGSLPFSPVTLATAVTRVVGPGGELQLSAGERWQKTFEGQGGIIGIELYEDQKKGKVVFDFNCGGLWRAWFDEETGKPRIMVFKGEYE